MPAPKTEKEIRGFLGRLQYISRFIARLTDICEPIFRLLRKNQPTVWNDDCQFAFEKIKEYLLSPPVLVPPTPGRPLLLYLSVSDMALGCMLAQIDDLGKERAIYYLNPLRYLFDRPALTGRLMRWLVLLTEFDIQYVSQKSIKGSIVDHLASLPTSEDRPVDDDFPDEEFVAMTSLSGWCMYFDGAANQSGYGIGVLLVSPQGDHIPRSVRLAFSDRHPATNNIVEYEACILGLETALELDIRQMEVFGDSNLFLRSGTYPEVATAKDRRALRNLARFVICGDTLYRRSADELHALTSPWPFSVWGIDIIGKVSPKSSSGHEFILVAIDYFTKWVEAASYARLTSARVASFIRSHIICRYGVPHELISDRGVHFRAEVDTLLQEYGIRHHRSSAYRPQTNGAVEAANKNIKRILRKMVETSRDWSEKLPFALWAYRTSFRTLQELRLTL
ncbi:Transposon Tf2-11 polyprotein [Vitis vinifera]|uniref:Transposon Tf2-11 polyprotein n=1 Tax=Vitis vinifera TaxID=29760 RepID=A0A438BL98_VITVI|nr:Transposon Tf2-11 polyprotein [Vitis vinifera]